MTTALFFAYYLCVPLGALLILVSCLPWRRISAGERAAFLAALRSIGFLSLGVAGLGAKGLANSQAFATGCFVLGGAGIVAFALHLHNPKAAAKGRWGRITLSVLCGGMVCGALTLATDPKWWGILGFACGATGRGIGHFFVNLDAGFGKAKSVGDFRKIIGKSLAGEEKD